MGSSIESYIRQVVSEAVKTAFPAINIDASSDYQRTPLVVANWKMNKNLKEAIQFLNCFNGNSKINSALCPPTHLLYAMSIFLKSAERPIALGAQNVHWADEGAFTGEVSADMLLEAGFRYVIVGHSERRQHDGETSIKVGLKVEQATKKGLIPIICIGETLEEKENGQTKNILRGQLEEALNAKLNGPIVIAYEPVWAIGTGKSATPEYAQEVHAFIRIVISDLIGRVAEATSILYGGSVNKENARQFAECPDIDGALVGGASLDSKSFEAIIRVFAKGD